MPGVTKNLLSVETITDDWRDYKILFNSKRVWILRGAPSLAPYNVVASSKRDKRNGLYKFCPPDDLVNHVTLETKEYEALL